MKKSRRVVSPEKVLNMKVQKVQVSASTLASALMFGCFG